MFITVQNIGGTSLGPYDIYHDAITPALLVTASISSASLAAGIDLQVPDNATSLYVVNTRSGCTGTGQVAQGIALPPPFTGSTVYHSVTVNARFTELVPQRRALASLYYKLNGGNYTYLGDFSGSTCVTFPPIVVPDLTVISLGITSGSLEYLSFDADAGTGLCSGFIGPLDYCGTIAPYSQRITTTGDITVACKSALDTCGRIPPSGPGTGAPGSTEITAVQIGDYPSTFKISRVRNRVTTVLYEVTQTVTPVINFSGLTTPSIQPNDIIILELSSAASPSELISLTVVDISSLANPVQIYSNPLSTTPITFTWTVPYGSTTSYSILANGGSINNGGAEQI